MSSFTIVRKLNQFAVNQATSKQVEVVETSPQAVSITSNAPTLAEVIESKSPIINLGSTVAMPGWRFIQDAMYTQDAPLQTLGGTRFSLPNNGFGTLSNSYGADSSSWYDKVTSKFQPDNVGDVFLYRLNFTIVPLVNNKSIAVDFDIGTPNKIYNDSKINAQGAGIPKAVSFIIPISASQSFKNNGGKIYLTCETDALIYGVSVLVFKQFGLSEAK